MSMDLALFSEKLASCRTLSIFFPMLKSAGTSCHMDAAVYRRSLPHPGRGVSTGTHHVV